MKKKSSLFGDFLSLASSLINFRKNNKLDLFAVGYKEAADILVVEIEKGNKQDKLVYPVVFLYRHYLELRLKEIIVQGNELLESKEKFPYGHKLDGLWKNAKEVMKKVWEGSEEPEEFSEIESVIHEFSTVDPDSQSFRYPESTNGENKLAGLQFIDTPSLKAKIEKVSNFLEGVSVGISSYLAERPIPDQFE